MDGTLDTRFIVPYVSPTLHLYIASCCPGSFLFPRANYRPCPSQMALAPSLVSSWAEPWHRRRRSAVRHTPDAIGGNHHHLKPLCAAGVVVVYVSLERHVLGSPSRLSSVVSVTVLCSLHRPSSITCGCEKMACLDSRQQTSMSRSRSRPGNSKMLSSRIVQTTCMLSKDLHTGLCFLSLNAYSWIVASSMFPIKSLQLWSCRLSFFFYLNRL